MNNSFKATVLVIVLATAFTCVLWLGLHKTFETRRRELIAQDHETVAAHQRDWARERVQRELAAHQAALDRARRREQELQTALGGPAAAAAKNPDLSIGAAMEQVAQACAPPGTRVRVRVDRFTEFTVLLELPRRLSEAALSDMARCVLAHSSEHVERLQFSVGGSLMAELDRRAIESVTDWKSVSTAAVSHLVSRSDSGTDSVVVAQPNQGRLPEGEPEAAQNLTEEGRRQLQTSESFKASMAEAHKEFQSVLQLQQQAVDLKDVHTLQDMDAKRKVLEKAETLSLRAATVLEDPVAEYRRILQAARLDELYVRTATRTLATQYDTSQVSMTVVFKRLADRTRSARGFLDAMARHFGDWRYHDLKGQIQFDTPAAHREFEEARGRWDQDSRELESAIKVWSQRVGDAARAP